MISMKQISVNTASNLATKLKNSNTLLPPHVKRSGTKHYLNITSKHANVS